MGGIFHLKLSIFSSPIVNKYHEGKMQSTLKRGLNVPETTVLQAVESFDFRWISVLVAACGLHDVHVAFTGASDISESGDLDQRDCRKCQLISQLPSGVVVLRYVTSKVSFFGELHFLGK